MQVWDFGNVYLKRTRVSTQTCICSIKENSFLQSNINSRSLPYVDLLEICRCDLEMYSEGHKFPFHTNLHMKHKREFFLITKTRIYRYMGFVDKYCIQKSLMNSTFIGEVEFVVLLVSRFSDYMIQPPSKACRALGECCILYCWWAVAEGGSNTANFKMLYILLARVIV